MKASPGLNRYLYEYLFHQAITATRENTGEIIPISQAKAIRRDVARGFASAQRAANEGRDANADPIRLGPKAFAHEINTAITESVTDAEPPYSTPADVNRAQSEFIASIGLSGSRPGPGLPLSPYDPEWSRRSSVRRGGTDLSYISVADIDRVCDGRVEGVEVDDPDRFVPALTAPNSGEITVWQLDSESKPVEAGRAMSDEDASGLTALQPMMRADDFEEIREWVLDGARDPATGVIDRNQFMTRAAVDRSLAMLNELQAQGLDYRVSVDQQPGQIKAKVSSTGMEIRLADTRRNEAVVGARVYDNGVTTRFSLGNDRSLLYSASPAEAVSLLRFAQGRAVERTDKPGQAVGTADSYYPGRGAKLESSAMFTLGTVPGHSDEPVYIRREGAARTREQFFGKEEAAQAYLETAVSTARENLTSALDVDGLVAEYERQAATAILDEDGRPATEFMPPEFSAESEIAAIQRSYWDVLTGRRADLLRPGATAQMYEERLGEIGEDAEAGLGNLVYGGTAEEKVRAHAAEIPDELIGTVESQLHLVDDEFVDKRFDAVRVSRYMTSEHGQFHNLDNLASASRKLGHRPDEVLGTGFASHRFADRLIAFDKDTAVPMNEHPSEFVRKMGESITGAISRSSAEVGQVDIDSNGVVSWTANKRGRGETRVPITGTVGQIFTPGEHGEIVTQFASGENALVVPGYEARIAAQKFGETKSVEERTILRGYEQMMAERIEHQVIGDITAARSTVGDPASLNGVYSQLYGTKHPTDFLEQATQYSVDETTGEVKAELDSWTKSIVDTEARRIRYANDIKAGSTMFAAYQAKNGRDDPADDTHFDAWKLTGGRNMVVLTGKDSNGVQAPAGYFDPIMTGGAMNQGIVRYLTTDAEVGPDGRIVPGDPETLSGARAPLMTREEMASLAHDAFDRQQMTATTIMQSSSVTPPTGTAMMTFGGWTADDPIVVSKEFAESNAIIGAGGQRRPLVVGDKLSDFHGNKGVLSLIVDRDMSLEEAREQGLEREVAWFKENPGMDVVMSPFSLISRRNAGAGRELMSVFDEDEGRLQAGLDEAQGRLADSENDLDGGALAEAAEDARLEGLGDYKYEGGFLADPVGEQEGTVGGLGQMRFIVTHMAVDEKTKVYDDEQILAGRGRKASSQLSWALSSQDCPAIMREFYGPNAGAEANLREYLNTVGLSMDATGKLGLAGAETEAPTRQFFGMPELVRNARGGLETRAMTGVFRDTIGTRGGDMEIPFPLTFPTGETTEQVSPTSWKLPVLSSHLRSGQEFDDGSVVHHDYTNRYLDIFKEACAYRMAAEKSQNPESSSRDKAAADAAMAKSARRAQRRFQAVTGDLENRVLTGRKNYFKTGVMSSRLPDSATAVWTSDPRLDIDQVAMGPAMAEQLGFAAGDHALIWRDPVLREDGVRYMEVAIDERLTGVAINPAMAKCFDGDFDGDAVAVVRLHSEAAKAEAMQKLSVPMNLLDHSVPTADGMYPLGMNVSLDTQVALSKDPEAAEEFESARREINRVELEARQAGMTPEALGEAWENNTALVEELSDLYRTSQRSAFGDALSFADRDRHLESMRAVCVDTGAKGSEKKLEDYARALGDGMGSTGLTQADQEGTQFAAGMKAHATGLGGGVAQRAMRALHNVDAEAATQMTSRVTQSILQAKHDPAEADHLYDMGQSAVRDVWRGRSIEHVGGGQWKPVFEDGAPVQASRDEWVAQVTDFYSSKAGLGIGVNPRYVERVADALVDPQTGRMRNIEDDPSLDVAPLDRMAYGGTMADLVEMARKGENIYDGQQNEHFAPSATASARRRAARAEQTLEADLDSIVHERVPESLIKPDVMAEGQDKAAARGSRRRSQAAVAVGTRPSPRLWTPAIDVPEPSDGDRGFGD